MFLNIKNLLVALLISSLAMAQESGVHENIDSSYPQESTSQGKNIGNITIGPYIPSAIGNNFVNDGMGTKIGVRLSVKFIVLKSFYIGPYFSTFKADVTNRELLGNYNRTTNFLAGAVVGYEKRINDITFNLGIGLGRAIYHNKAQKNNFKDTAIALSLNPEVSYRISTYIGLYLAPEFRHDFMNIDVPDELNDTFNDVNYFTISFGLRINLGSAYKNL